MHLINFGYKHVAWYIPETAVTFLKIINEFKIWVYSYKTNLYTALKQLLNFANMICVHYLEQKAHSLDPL